MESSRLTKQCWRCKYFSDNMPEHFKAIASVSGLIQKICTHGQDISAPPPCPQFTASNSNKDRLSLYATKSYGNWKQKTTGGSLIRQLA